MNSAPLKTGTTTETSARGGEGDVAINRSLVGATANPGHRPGKLHPDSCSYNQNSGPNERPFYSPFRGTRHMNEASRQDNGRADVLLVCSSGGHLLQLVSLASAWEGSSHMWVSFDKSDVRSLLAGERLITAHGPTNRNIPNLLRNLWLALGVVRQVRPRIIVTTGAGVAVPFAWFGKIFGAHVVYVESFTRIDSISLSCRLIKPVADRVYVQWPEAVPLVAGARYVGNVFADPQ